MMLISTFFGNSETFKMMPVTLDAPFTEVIYDPNTNMLVVITSKSKQMLQMVPKLDDNGNHVKATKPRDNNKGYKEKQVTLELLQEFYIIKRDEQSAFIKACAINPEFDFESYFAEHDKKNDPNALITPEAAPLVDANGKPLKVVKAKGGKKA